MYCIKCGVELADSEKVCPLCGTRVFHPDLPRSESEAPFPRMNINWASVRWTRMILRRWII